ncbi:hypothetical protein WJX81_006328 [Elliptochloris bilobata]|uniref:Uncharacterized protein n=1 Tax=Elliptochloris bilobata TaxID=381761 RepID=A0AAW1QKE6_9CHLO
MDASTRYHCTRADGACALFHCRPLAAPHRCLGEYTHRRPAFQRPRLACYAKAKKALGTGRSEAATEEEAQMYLHFGSLLGQSAEETADVLEQRGGPSEAIATAIRGFLPSKEEEAAGLAALEARIRGAAAAAGGEEAHSALARAKAKAPGSEQRDALRREALRELMANAALAKVERRVRAAAMEREPATHW